MGAIRPATASDIQAVVDNIRAEDRREIEDVSGRPITELPSKLARLREPVWAAVASPATPIAVFGAVTAPDNSGAAVWLVGTPGIVEHRVEFLRRSHSALETVFGSHVALFNCVDERNAAHIRWLKWLGFTFVRRRECYGVHQIPVLEFIKLNPNV